MAKKKTKQQSAQPLSPKMYIRTKARSLPIAECLINRDWKENGLAQITIARQHKTGNYTAALYMVDMLCLGVKDTHYKFNIPIAEYEDLKIGEFDLQPISYNEAHNIIFGALAYADDLGIAPHKDFQLTQYILEEDTKEIPLIEYEFGKDGKPLLMVYSEYERNKYLPILRKNVGDGNFDFCYDEEYMPNYEEEEEFSLPNKETMLKNLEKMQERFEKSASLPHTEYAYQHPEYPTELQLNHKELEVFFDPKNYLSLDVDTINTISALPRETLIDDLNRIVLYEIGRTYNNVPDETWGENYASTLMHALFFIGELKSEQNLAAVLETMRQNSDFYEFHFGDSADEMLPLTLYYVGKNQLPTLLEFAKEPNLYRSLKSFVFNAVATIAFNEPDRRQEVIEWFRAVLTFYRENISDTAYYDAGLTGLMMSELMDMHANELLPEIKSLYDTGLVDEMCCGTYEDVAKEIYDLQKPLNDYTLLDIYKRYEEYSNHWKN